MKKDILTFTSIILLTCFMQSAFAITYQLPKKNGRLIGKNIEITIPEKNKFPLEKFAAKYQMGLSNLLEANPNIDVYLPKGNTKLIIPQKLILPNTPHKGIIINSSEMRLYYYPKNKNSVVVFPIGIGELNSNTPRNWITKIRSKKANPVWRPTQTILSEYATRKEKIPKVFPSGPKNPMGLYALYIGKSYAIHGTNANFGIGLRVTHGCIRLRANDIKWLFQNVPVGTRVQFIDQPIKTTLEADGSCYIEVHTPLSTSKKELKSSLIPTMQITKMISDIINNPNVNQKLVNQAFQEHNGIPLKINY